MGKKFNIEEMIVKNMYNTVSAMKPSTYTELRDEDGERYYSFEIMLDDDDDDFDTAALEIKLEDFFDKHDEIETVNHRLQFQEYDVVNENGFKELNVLFRVLD